MNDIRLKISIHRQDADPVHQRGKLVMFIVGQSNPPYRHVEITADEQDTFSLKDLGETVLFIHNNTVPK